MGNRRCEKYFQTLSPIALECFSEKYLNFFMFLNEYSGLERITTYDIGWLWKPAENRPSNVTCAIKYYIVNDSNE